MRILSLYAKNEAEGLTQARINRQGETVGNSSMMSENALYFGVATLVAGIPGKVAALLDDHWRRRQIIGSRVLPRFILGKHGVNQWMIADVGHKRVEANLFRQVWCQNIFRGRSVIWSRRPGATGSRAMAAGLWGAPQGDSSA